MASSISFDIGIFVSSLIFIRLSYNSFFTVLANFILSSFLRGIVSHPQNQIYHKRLQLANIKKVIETSRKLI